MRKVEEIKNKFREILNSEDVPEHIITLLSYAVKSGNLDVDTLMFIYDIKDNITPELSSILCDLIEKNAPLKWLMLVITVYEEKIDKTMDYMDFLQVCFDKGIDVGLLDEMQKTTSTYEEFYEAVCDKEQDRIFGHKQTVPNLGIEDTGSILGNGKAAEVSAVQKDNETLKGLLNTHMEEITKLRSDIFYLQRDAFEQKRCSLSLETEVSELQKENKQLTNAKRMIEKRLASMENLCDSLKKLNEKLRIEYDDLMSEKSVLEEANSGLWEEKKKAEQENQTIYAENKELKNEILRLENELKENQNKNESHYEDSVSSSDEIFESDDSNIYTESFMQEMNEELQSNIYHIMQEEEIDDDFGPSGIISMVPDTDQIMTHRSLFIRILNSVC